MKSDKYRKTRNYLVGLGYGIAQSNQIIRRFGKSTGADIPKRYEDRSKQSMMELFIAGKQAQADWDGFMKFYWSIKGDYVKARNGFVNSREPLDTDEIERTEDL